MKPVSVDSLSCTDFSIRFVNSLKMFWRKRKIHYQNVPKVHNNLVLLHNCSAVYTLPSSKTFTAHSGDIVFAPIQSQYTVEFFDSDPVTGSTIGINLHLHDPDGEELLLADAPFIAASGEKVSLHSLFEQINENAMAYPPCMTRIYSDLYHIFSLFTAEGGHSAHIGGKYASIARAITHLRCEDAYTMKIADMARECNVSESYLRRQFKQYSGMSPVKYVRLRKLLAAKNLLQYSDLSVDEIAYRLNFTDTSYFCKVFHQETGFTPAQYRRQYAEE